MAKRRLKLNELRRILASFGVTEDKKRGKGSHTTFVKQFPEEPKPRIYSMPSRKDVLPCYVKDCRRRFRLTPEDGVTDEDFYGRK